MSSFVTLSQERSAPKEHEIPGLTHFADVLPFSSHDRSVSAEDAECPTVGMIATAAGSGRSPELT